MENVTLILPAIEVERWKQFQQHYDIFQEMLEKDAFSIQYGKCTLNFAHGQLQNIVKEEIVWRR